MLLNPKIYHMYVIKIKYNKYVKNWSIFVTVLQPNVLRNFCPFGWKRGEKCGLRFLVINLEFRFTVTTRPELNVPEKESSNRGEMLTLSSQHVLLCLQAGAGRTLVLPVLHVLQSSGNRSSGQRGSDRQSFHWYFSLLLFFFGSFFMSST